MKFLKRYNLGQEIAGTKIEKFYNHVLFTSANKTIFWLFAALYARRIIQNVMAAFS